METKIAVWPKNNIAQPDRIKTGEMSLVFKIIIKTKMVIYIKCEILEIFMNVNVFFLCFFVGVPHLALPLFSLFLCMFM